MAKVLNIQRAKQAGFTDEQIQQYMTSRPGVGIKGAAPAQPEGALDRVADWLPTAGGVAGSFLPVVGPIAGGAIGAGAGTLAKQFIQRKPFDPGEVAKEAALGLAGGVAGKVAAPLIRPIASRAGRLLGQGGELIAENAAKSVLDTSPSAFRNAAEIGVNVNKAFVKHSPFIFDNTIKGFDAMVDDALGPIAKNLPKGVQAGGKLGARIKMFENEIGQVVKEAGSQKMIPGSDIVKALRTELAAEKAVIGNDARVGILDNIIKQTEKLYKNGTTVSKALNKIRIANRQFGRSILEDQTGSMISSAQKMEANVLRKTLKSMFPTIANALDNEQELIIIREILGNSRAKNGVSIPFSQIDFSKPGSIFKYLLGGKAGAAKIAQAGGKVAQEGVEGVLPGAGAAAAEGAFPSGQVAARGAEQIGARALMGGETPTEEQPVEGEVVAPNEGSPMSDFAGTNNKKEKIRQAFTMAMMKNPKQAKTLKDIYDFGFADEGGGPGANVGKTTAKDFALAKSGMKNVEQVRKLYREDPSSLTKNLVPGQFLSRKWDSTLYDAADTLLRLRTGAQANPTEIRAYMTKIAPAFGDSPSVVEYKLNKLEDDLSFYLQGGTGSPTLEDFAGAYAE